MNQAPPAAPIQKNQKKSMMNFSKVQQELEKITPRNIKYHNYKQNNFEDNKNNYNINFKNILNQQERISPSQTSKKKENIFRTPGIFSIPLDAMHNILKEKQQERSLPAKYNRVYGYLDSIKNKKNAALERQKMNEEFWNALLEQRRINQNMNRESSVGFSSTSVGFSSTEEEEKFYQYQRNNKEHESFKQRIDNQNNLLEFNDNVQSTLNNQYNEQFLSSQNQMRNRQIIHVNINASHLEQSRQNEECGRRNNLVLRSEMNQQRPEMDQDTQKNSDVSIERPKPFPRGFLKMYQEGHQENHLVEQSNSSDSMYRKDFTPPQQTRKLTEKEKEFITPPRQIMRSKPWGFTR